MSIFSRMNIHMYTALSDTQCFIKNFHRLTRAKFLSPFDKLRRRLQNYLLRVEGELKLPVAVPKMTSEIIENEQKRIELTVLNDTVALVGRDRAFIYLFINESNYKMWK